MLPQHPYVQRLLDDIDRERLAWTGLTAESHARQRGIAPADHNWWVRWLPLGVSGWAAVPMGIGYGKRLVEPEVTADAEMVLSPADHNWDPEWNGRWVRWGADLDELIEPDRDCRLEQGEARAREQTNRILARRA